MKLNAAFQKDEANPVFQTRRVSKIVDGDLNPWKTDDNGVLGMGIKSDLISYLYE